MVKFIYHLVLTHSKIKNSIAFFVKPHSSIVNIDVAICLQLEPMEELLFTKAQELSISVSQKLLTSFRRKDKSHSILHTTFA